LRGEKTREELFTDYVGWFTERHVDLHTGVRAVRLDAGRKVIATDNGDEISFDKLLIATGGIPKHLALPGASLANVHYLRNLADADRLHNAIEKAKKEGRPFDRGSVKHRGAVTIIGGGLLGVELAGTLTSLGLSVDLVVAAPHPWKRFAGEFTGNFVARYLEQQGVKVHLRAEAQSLDGDGRVQRVALSDGQVLACDFVVAAVGMLPNKDLLRGTPITGERAILTDDHARTNMPDIFAAGDCAALFDPLFGKHRQLDHWESAVITGTLAGRNMAGGDTRYDAVSHFSSDTFGLHLSAWGESRHIDHRILRGAPSGDSTDLIEIGVAADGRVAQVLAINHRGEDDALRKLVQTRFAVAGKEEQLRDPNVRLQELI
jgi:NAD(P)H-nitrite reductase large subunit